MVIMCPILTAEAMRITGILAIRDAEWAAVKDDVPVDTALVYSDLKSMTKVYEDPTTVNGIIPCRRDCGMWNRCHGIKMKDEYDPNHKRNDIKE